MPFAIADRFPGVSPAAVYDWPEDLVERALGRMQIESAVAAERHQAEKERQERAARGADTLGEDWPELA